MALMIQRNLLLDTAELTTYTESHKMPKVKFDMSSGVVEATTYTESHKIPKVKFDMSSGVAEATLHHAKKGL